VSGTEGSNPSPSSGESAANLTSSGSFWRRSAMRIGAALDRCPVSLSGDRGFESCSLQRRVRNEPSPGEEGTGACRPKAATRSKEIVSGNEAEVGGSTAARVPVGKSVKDVLGLAPPADQTHRRQDLQPRRHGGNLLALVLGQLRDAGFAFGEPQLERAPRQWDSGRPRRLRRFERAISGRELPISPL
jgi:hypothetical protein